MSSLRSAAKSRPICCSQRKPTQSSEDPVQPKIKRKKHGILLPLGEICQHLLFLNPWWLRRESVCLKRGRPGFDPWVGKIPWRRKWQPTPVFLPGKSHGRWNLVGYNPWGHKESDMTEWLHFHFQSLQVEKLATFGIRAPSPLVFSKLPFSSGWCQGLGKLEWFTQISSGHYTLCSLSGHVLCRQPMYLVSPAP